MVAAYLTPVGPVSYETKNVTWMTKVTGRSMSQPIVVGDRIFLGANISDLMCISKADGRVLWLRTTTPYDALPAAEKNSRHQPALRKQKPWERVRNAARSRLRPNKKQPSAGASSDHGRVAPNRTGR